MLEHSNVLYTDGELNPFAPSFGSKRMSKDDINVPLLDIFFVAIVRAVSHPLCRLWT